MIEVDGQALLLVSSWDTHLTLWTIHGGLVGELGRNTWDISDIKTWLDPHADHKPKCDLLNDEYEGGFQR